ncbi:MAG: trigger factor [Armatimonadota bacterium]|nr:trigger factor [Armatimonadota bacterium]
MQVTVEHQDACTTTLNVEVDAEQVVRTVKGVYKELAQKVDIPGFRRGKAPQAILERYISPESVRQRAIEELIPIAYAEALKQTDLHPFAEPELEVVKFEMDSPFIFKAKVPLPPKVEVGDYKGIEVERPKVEVTDKDVEAQLEHLRESRATSKPVEDRGVENGDFVIAEITSRIEGEENSRSTRSILHVGTNLPDFDKAIIGMKPGEKRTFSLTYPVDFADPDLAGKKAEFDVTVDSIRIRVLPELNDEFAKEISNFETLDQLREDIRRRLVELRNREADREVDSKIVEQIVSRSSICFPEVMVEHEVHHDLEDIEEQVKRQNATMEDYLRQTGQTEEQLLENLREAASRRLRAGLVLGEIANKEGIQVSDEEVEAEIDRIATEEKTTREAVVSFLDTQGGTESLRNRLLNRKIFEFLRSVSNIKSAENSAEST